MSLKKWDLVDLEEKTFPRNIKGIFKGLDIYVYGIVDYSIISESGCMVLLQYQAYYVTGLPKDFCIICLQGICTPEGNKVTFIAHFHDDNDRYTQLNLKDENPGQQKDEHMERVYIKYQPNEKLPTYEALLSNQIQKDIKALARTVYVNNNAKQNLTTSHKYIL